MDVEIVDETPQDSATTKEKEFQVMFKTTLESIPLDALTFTHHVVAYYILATQSNSQVGATLNLVHTEESIMREKDAIKTLLTSTQSPTSDFLFNDNSDGEEKDVGPSTALTYSNWASTNSMQSGDLKREILAQCKEAVVEPPVDDPIQQRILNFYMDNFKLHKMNIL